jgi:hypothetical protein
VAVDGPTRREHDQDVDLLRRAHPTPASTAYVLLVAAAAAVGFAVGSPAPILLAAAATLPASLLTLPLFYLAYGLLALVPGANPSSSSGSGSSTADGVVTSNVTGETAGWFTATTHVAGVLLLTAGAVADVVLVRSLAANRRRRTTPRPADQSA